MLERGGVGGAGGGAGLPMVALAFGPGLAGEAVLIGSA
jgi:hypothetical protein